MRTSNIVDVRRLKVKKGLQSFLNTCTEQSPKESDETRCTTNTNLTS